MSRPPHARAAILAAAEEIVKDIGAANLTYDELVRRSGITRGGITYHFPTKDGLLRALVEHDLQRWNDCLADKRAACDAAAVPVRLPVVADLLAYIASGSEPSPETSRLCAGLLSAATSSRDLNGPWRDFFASQRKALDAAPDPDLAAILSLAVDGLFWLETLGLSSLPARRRASVVRRMTALAAAMDDRAGEDVALPVKKAPARRRA
jgi:AcrR family transcriptional regulator